VRRRLTASLRRLATAAGSAYFLRTFLLLAGLVVACTVAIFAAYRLLDDAPPEQRLAWEIASVVNLTRSALLGSDPARRMLMLEELARQEEVRVVPLESSDRIDVSRTTAGLAALEARLRLLLADNTMVAARVNDEDGVWVSFDIAGDGYWLLLPADRAERQLTPSLGLIVLIAGVIASAGALAIAWLVDRPLSQLSRAITLLGRGESPAPLREDGPPQLAQVKREFNRLATDLAELENDRSIALAGISHDLRGPLTRLRMEVEIARLEEGQRDAMVEDIARLNAIVGQFVDYARSNQPPRVREVLVPEELAGVVAAYDPVVRAGTLQLGCDIEEAIRWSGDPTDLQRVVSNLVDNALRYARPTDGSGQTRVELKVSRNGGCLTIEVRDHGPGIPRERLEEAKRPFARLDSARTDSGGTQPGTGLGLAIVSRICRRYGGDFSLANAQDGGLIACARLPDWQQPRPLRG
jgi:two-component system osmolarity sensor histidine kinase EnvZ